LGIGGAVGQRYGTDADRQERVVEADGAAGQGPLRM
jgi:hypothetical protein